MQQASLFDRCKVNTNWDEDIFVGLKCDGDDISIHFPLGFDISHEEKELRSDILLLLDTIRSTTSGILQDAILLSIYLVQTIHMLQLPSQVT